MSDLSSSASWVGNLLAACSVEVMYASMGVFGGNGINGAFL